MWTQADRDALKLALDALKELGEGLDTGHTICTALAERFGERPTKAL